jgi:hypothetical protein
MAPWRTRNAANAIFMAIYGAGSIDRRRVVNRRPTELSSLTQNLGLRGEPMRNLTMFRPARTHPD